MCVCLQYGACVCVDGFFFSFYQDPFMSSGCWYFGHFRRGASRPIKHHKIMNNSFVLNEYFESEIIIFPKPKSTFSRFFRWPVIKHYLLLLKKKEIQAQDIFKKKKKRCCSLHTFLLYFHGSIGTKSTDDLRLHIFLHGLFRHHWVGLWVGLGSTRVSQPDQRLLYRVKWLSVAC